MPLYDSQSGTHDTVKIDIMYKQKLEIYQWSGELCNMCEILFVHLEIDFVIFLFWCQILCTAEVRMIDRTHRFNIPTHFPGLWR